MATHYDLAYYSLWALALTFVGLLSVQRVRSWVQLQGTSKNGPFSDLLSMAPDVSLVRRGLFGAISVFLPPDAQVGA